LINNFVHLRVLVGLGKDLVEARVWLWLLVDAERLVKVIDEHTEHAFEIAGEHCAVRAVWHLD